MALRLWRSRPAYRFSRAIHEQIRDSMPYDLTERFGPPTLRIRHYGYLKARIDERDKHQRNLELLQGELEANPRAAFTHFNIGTEYVGMEDLASARRHFEQRLAFLREEHAWWELGYAPILVSRLCGVRRMCGDLEGCEALADELLGHFPDFTDLVFERALAAQDRHDLEGAATLFMRCLEMGNAPPRFSGVVGRGSFLALGALALVSTNLGLVEEAAGWFERSLELHRVPRRRPRPREPAARRSPTPIRTRCSSVSTPSRTTSSPGTCSSAPRSTSAATPCTASACCAAASRSARGMPRHGSACSRRS